VEKLKQCPFCGADGQAYEVFNYPEKVGKRYSVICVKCGASVSTIYQAESKAINMWNQRSD